MREGPRFHLDRRALLAGGAALVVAGCSNIIGPPEAPQIYVLKPRVMAARGARVGWSLAIDLPDATDSYDTSRIAISRSANTLDYYANAAWPDRLPVVIQSTIVDAFEDSGRTDQVSRANEGLHATYTLQSEIEEFEAHYDQPDGAPVAVVKIAVKLLDEKTRAIVAHASFAKEQSATANSVAAAVDAFDGALGDALGAIVSWALGAAPPAHAA